jgi:hypothetical protein
LTSLVRTVRGDQPPGELGVTDAHDHLLLESPVIPGSPLSRRFSASMRVLINGAALSAGFPCRGVEHGDKGSGEGPLIIVSAGEAGVSEHLVPCRSDSTDGGRSTAAATGPPGRPLVELAGGAW